MMRLPERETTPHASDYPIAHERGEEIIECVRRVAVRLERREELFTCERLPRAP